MAEADPNRDPLEALAAEFAERHRRGESPSVSEYARLHPELAEEIRELFPTLVAVERLKARTERSANGRASLGPIKLERLGDFRIIREIGRGGMGIVYEAEQESLGRRVAIKVLPRQSLLDANQLARFQREAQTAGGLHHTNIVQVFGVGDDEGFHYYVMQLVHGVGVDSVISYLAKVDSASEAADAPEGTGGLTNDAPGDVARVCRQLIGRESGQPSPGISPAYWQSVARIGLQVADALGYAHSHGILHRDIKPANLLLDDRGVVWITDFGLAKGTQSASVTQPGDVTGTLRYMAPERFQGKVDARSDIYSLGLTLYELLTLRPAYDDPDRTSLLRRITQGEPAPPRRLNAGIPRDLETIVLKAIAHDASHRYASADALAADLRCYLEDRPIESRRATSPERLWRWCRRNRAVAALTGATLLLLVAVAAATTVGYVRTNRALKGEAAQRQKAEAVAMLAQEALDRVFDRLGPARAFRRPESTMSGTGSVEMAIPSPPVISKETAALLEEMLPFFDRLADQTGEDTELRRKTAEANRRVGDIRQLLGQYDQAVEAYRRAIGIYEGSGDRPGAHANPRLKIAEVYNELGRLYRAKRQLTEANDSHSRALSVLQSIPATTTRPAELRYELARTYYFMGTPVLAEPGSRPPGPRGESPRRAPPRGPEHEPPPPPEEASPPDRPPPRPPQDSPPDRPRRTAVDDDNLRKATDLLDELARESPSRPEYRYMLALCCRDRHAALFPRDSSASSESLDRAITILEQLVHDYPQVPEYRRDLSETYAMGDLQDPSLTREGFTLAEGRLQKASAIAQELVVQYSQVPEYLSWQAQVCHRLGVVLRQLQRLDDAEENDRKAVSAQTKLAEQLPDVPSHKIWLAAFRNSLADLLLRRDKIPEARSLAEGTISMLSSLLDANPDMAFLHTLLAESDRTLAAVLRRSGDEAASSRAEREAERHRRSVLDRPPGDPGTR